MIKDAIHQYMQTNDSWNEYTQNMTHSGFLDYLDATGDFVKVLDAILENSKSFELLQSNLIELVKDRKDFISYGGLNLP